MTYDEIKKRLTQVEEALQSIQHTKSPAIGQQFSANTVEKLTTIKESLQKQLTEKEETMFISTRGGATKAVQMDRKAAMDLRKDPNISKIDTAKGQSLKEFDRLDKNSGVEFDKNETKAIATQVGKALAISLKKAGDELARMKAHHIDINSFDIQVDYKGENGNDEFSFYISDDSLHLVDFSFDKELVNIGVKPSGEAIINVDVLTNELLKHFKSLNEKVNYKGRELSSEEEVRLDLIAHKEFGDRDFKKLSDEEKDQVFAKRDKVGVKEGEGDDHHYLKVSKRDYKKAQAILDQNVDSTYVKMEIVDNDGAGNVVFYFIFKHEYGFDDMYDDPEGKENPEFYQEPEEDPEAFIHDAVMDLQAQEIEVVDHSADHDIYNPNSNEDKDAPKVNEDDIVAITDKHYDYIRDIIDILKTGEVPQDKGFRKEAIKALASLLRDPGSIKEEKDPDSEAERKRDEKHDKLMQKIRRGDALGLGPKRLGENEAQEDAVYNLRNIVDQIEQLGDEARQIVRQNFPNEMSRMEAYGVFNMVYSNNRYDVTLGGEVDRIEGGDYDDLNEATAAKIQKAYGQLIAKMKELAKQYKDGDKSVVPQLKDLTAKKKELEKHLDQAVSGTNRDQELAEMYENIIESLSPEVSKKVAQFIKAMAKRYDYSEQDAVYAIMAALRKRDFLGVNEAENPILRQSKLSSSEYQKAKKLKGFNKDNYKWNADEDLYIKSLEETRKKKK